MQRRQLAGLNLLRVEQALRGAGVLGRDDVGGFQDVERALAEVAQIADRRRDDMEDAGAGRLGGIEHGVEIGNWHHFAGYFAGTV
jgi:hypothetical protein